MRKLLRLAAYLNLCMAWTGSLVRADDPPKPVVRSEAEKEAIAKIRKLGGLVIEVAQNDPRWEVSYLQNDAKFTEEHLAPLKNLKDVVYLNLRAQPVTDQQLAHIKKLGALTRLHVEKTTITDQGLAALSGLANLEYLNIYGTKVSDAGLAHLEGLKKLKHLYVFQTQVTDAGVAKLKQALPQLEIIRGIDASKIPEAKPPEPEKKPDEKKKDG